MEQAKVDTANRLNAGCAGTEQGAARDKRWDECGIEEKVERLRAEQQDRSTIIDAGFNLARKAWRLVNRHQHADDGRVLVDAEDRSGENEGLLAGRRFDRLR